MNTLIMLNYLKFLVTMNLLLMDAVELPDNESTINDIVNSPAHKINVGPRRSARNNKGVPPPRYGIDQM